MPRVFKNPKAIFGASARRSTEPVATLCLEPSPEKTDIYHPYRTPRAMDLERVRREVARIEGLRKAAIAIGGIEWIPLRGSGGSAASLDLSPIPIQIQSNATITLNNNDNFLNSPNYHHDAVEHVLEESCESLERASIIHYIDGLCTRDVL